METERSRSFIFVTVRIHFSVVLQSYLNQKITIEEKQPQLLSHSPLVFVFSSVRKTAAHLITIILCHNNRLTSVAITAVVRC